MGLQYGEVLAADHFANRFGQFIVFERFTVFRDSRVFPSLALREDGMLIAA